MEAQAKLGEALAYVEAARGMPMSTSCIVNRDTVVTLMEQVRELLPAELAAAQSVLAARDAVLAEARRTADRIVAEARTEREALLAEHAVVAAARSEAAALTLAAHDEAVRLRREVDDYVDGKLAHFEVALERILGTVRGGREQLRGVTPGDRIAVDARSTDSAVSPD